MMGIGRKRAQVIRDESKSRLQEDIRQARREREVAQCLFESVVDFDRIDHAIFTLEAAEKKLDILLREAKELWGEAEGSERAGRRIVL